mmetsp:Transcript_25372/g.33928  ORF Transcript_25372/g.33928 Transcript_25372/m.33928 type:complete len:102 (+) Transcript_25372:891-1196(+)
MIILDPHNAAPALSNEPVVLQRNHIGMHERTAKKIAFNRLDPTMTFGFYLQSHKDLSDFKLWQEQKRKAHGEFWLFSAMQSKPAFLKQAAREYQASAEDCF